MPKLSNVTIKRISLVKKGANNQRLQFCKSADNDSIVCYECSKLQKNEGPSPEMIAEIDSIIKSNDSASDALCSIATRNVQLNPNEDVEVQFRKAVYKAMQDNPNLYEQHCRLVIDNPDIKSVQKNYAPWTTAENIETLESIMKGNDGACDMLCAIANQNLRLSPNENPKVTFQKALLEAINENPELLVNHHAAIDFFDHHFDYKKSRER